MEHYCQLFPNLSELFCRVKGFLQDSGRIIDEEAHSYAIVVLEITISNTYK